METAWNHHTKPGFPEDMKAKNWPSGGFWTAHRWQSHSIDTFDDRKECECRLNSPEPWRISGNSFGLTILRKIKLSHHAQLFLEFLGHNGLSYLAFSAPGTASCLVSAGKRRVARRATHFPSARGASHGKRRRLSWGKGSSSFLFVTKSIQKLCYWNWSTLNHYKPVESLHLKVTMVSSQHFELASMLSGTHISDGEWHGQICVELCAFSHQKEAHIQLAKKSSIGQRRGFLKSARGYCLHQTFQ